MDSDKVARRLSGALGKRIDPASVAVMYDGGDEYGIEIELADGSFWVLFPGNKVKGWPGHLGDEMTKHPLEFWRNGKHVLAEWGNNQNVAGVD